ncbi:MAG: D-alanine--D-alanine ligase [Treponema sp.]|jgi:D-alanine-D-alanine ligase|nr:D-alanine--D-alanine ligase [Treponema sp.]
MGKKITVGILFGGKSAEHEVSLQSARNVYEAIDRDSYDPVLIGIDKSGRWLLSGDSRSLPEAKDSGRIGLDESGDQVALPPRSRGVLSLLGSSSGRGADGAPALMPKLDVVFPILHGPFGEDGTVQGLLKLADIPFVGPGVLGSAAGMDKDVMKRLLRDGGVPIGKFLVLRSHEAVPPYGEVAAALGAPFFVKPANMGSSVGIRKIHKEEEYLPGLGEAFQYDSKVVLEEFIQGRELECSVLGNENPAASVPGEVIVNHEFYSYEAKYLDEKGAVLEIPAKLPPPVEARVRELALKTFTILCCEGLSRVDFFLRGDRPEDLLVNEINTMPGFTRISMYPKLWEASGISYAGLIDRLIRLAIERFEREKRIRTSYRTD